MPGILIVGGSFGFPNGTGAAARARCYATGLRDAGAQVHVAVIGVLRRGDPNQLLNTDARGVWHGVEFEYASGSVEGAPSLVGRRLQEIRGLLRLWVLIREWSRHKDLKAIVLFGSELRWMLPIRLMCSATGTSLVQEVSEYPFINECREGLPHRAYQWLYLRGALRLPDGIVVITTFLEDSLARFSGRRTWLLRLPIMVDVGRFDASVDADPGAIAYAGNLSHTSELDDLIAAVAPLAGLDTEINVRVLGVGTDAENEAFRREIDAHGLAGRAHLVGAVSADALPEELCKASVLVLARAEGLFSRAGMPTKLGEYLATGRPVVVTATGDIPLYLHDGVDCYLVPPGDVQLLSRAINRALHDPAAASVGAAGRETAIRCFNPAVQMSRLLDELGVDPSVRHSHVENE